MDGRTIGDRACDSLLSLVDETAEAAPRYRYEVIADDSGKWCGNGLTFASEAEAETGARDLASRWFLVREWRVVPVEGEES